MVSALEKFGVVSVGFLAVHVVRILSEYFYRRSVERYYTKNSLKDLGQWGVVLGADKSIGQAYAVELAKQGLNVVLIGSDSTKLSTLSSLLEKYFQVFTGVISLTFTNNEYKYMEKALSNLNIAVLVNAPDYAEGLTRPEYFLNIPEFDATLSSAINRNLTLVTKMCAIVMPGMVSKGKGIIVNVSSIASKMSCPLLALYGASAAYVEKLSEELRNEYSSSGVIVQTLLPGYVLRNRFSLKTKSWIMPSPKDYVGSAIKRLGIQGRTTGYMPHSILHGALLNLQAICPKTMASLIRLFMESVKNGSFLQLQFLDLTGATENDQSLIERVLFSSSQTLEVPWCTGRSGADENQAEQEWGNSCFAGEIEPRQDLPTNQVSTSQHNNENEGEQCGREESEEGNQTEHEEPGGPPQDQIPRQGGIFPGHPPTSLPHQAQPMFQMYQMVPSLSNVYVSNVTANVNVHAPYVPSIPAHYGHQIPPQQQQPPQQMYPHVSPEGEHGNRNRRQRPKTDKKRDGPFVQANEVISPSLENHPPPQFPNIHPMQPYYIPSAPGAPVYMQHTVLPVYPSPMFSPYGHTPGHIVYPQTNNIEPGNEEYHENVQQNFHQPAPEMVMVNCPVRQENATDRRGMENSENHSYPIEEQVQEPGGFKPDNVQFSTENGENQTEVQFPPQENGGHFEKTGGKMEAVTAATNFYEQKEKTKVDSSGQKFLGEHGSQFSGLNSDVKVSRKATNSEADVNNVDSSVNSITSAAGWVNQEAGERNVVPQSDTNKVKLNNCTNVPLVNAQESPVPVSQNSEFPLIGQNVKSSRETPSYVSPEPESTVGTPAAGQPTPSSGGKSWASLFNRSERYNSSPMSDNLGRPLALVPPYQEAENASPGVTGGHATVKSERVPSNKINGPLSKDSVPNSNVVNDPYLYNLGEFLCNYELEHKIVSLQPRGLTNRSNWCYVNAILQSLIACPPFYNLVKALPVRPSKKENKQTLIIDALVEYVNEFILLPANARIGKREKSARNKEESNVVEIVAGPAFEPSGIYKILDKVRGESSFNVEGRQEDAEEFLSCLLNGLNDEMFELMKMVDSNKVGGLSNGEANGSLEENGDEDETEWNVMGPKNKSSVTRRAVCGKTPISDIFRGQFRSRVQRAGDQSTDTVQPFFTLQLDIEKASSVKDALELFMGRDPLEGVTCSRTHQEVEAWTQTTLEDLPLVLILHLKCYDYKSDACSKIIKNVDFQVDLKIDAKLLSNRNKYTGKQRNYKLVAVVYHDGKEASKGHYVTDAYHVGYGCWLRYDDVVVRSVPESHVLKPRAPRVPYLLYYRRADTIGPTK